MKKINAAFKFLLALCLATALTACASGPKLVAHGFSYSGWADSWATKVDLLEYSYGDQYQMVQRKVRPNEGTLGYSSGVNGSMPVGEFLHVKWRIKATGEIVEDRVDLRGRLAQNMTGHAVTFVIDERQLYVYLVTPQGKKTDAPPILKTHQSRYYVTFEIYPNNTYKP